MKRRRLRKPKSGPMAKAGTIHDRRSTDTPFNAETSETEIADPMEAGERILVTRSLRDDRLAWLHSHKHIDQAQFQAGRRMQGLYEKASIGVKAVDPTNEPVDGGGAIPEALTEVVSQAVKEITRSESVLGREGSSLARDFLAFGNSIYQCAFDRGVPRDHQIGRKAIAYRVREILETLAVEFGFVSK